MPTKPSTYSSMAQLCKLYINQYNTYTTAQARGSVRDVVVAAKSLDELLCSIEKAASPTVFELNLEAQASKESNNV